MVFALFHAQTFTLLTTPQHYFVSKLAVLSPHFTKFLLNLSNSCELLVLIFSCFGAFCFLLFAFGLRTSYLGLRTSLTLIVHFVSRAR